MKRSWNNKTELAKEGLIHRLERLNEKIKAIPVKEKDNGKRQVPNKQ
jgi:hypothetical protein